MSLLSGSPGSSSPNARPEICSYCPASPNEAQDVPLQKAGETVSSTTILVMRACSGAEQTRIPATTANPVSTDLRISSDVFFDITRPPPVVEPTNMIALRGQTT